MSFIGINFFLKLICKRKCPELEKKHNYSNLLITINVLLVTKGSSKVVSYFRFSKNN